MPKVSIILPVYNGEEFLEWAIESVKNQKFQDWELLVVDDGSTDRTAEITEKFLEDKRIIYMKNEKNMGIQRSLNLGLSKAGGKYVARIDADDEWIDEEKLEKQVDFLDKNSDYILLGTGTIAIDGKGSEVFRYLNPREDQEIRRKMLFKNCFTHSSVIFRRGDHRYSEERSTRYVEDYDLWLRLGGKGKMYNFPTFSILWRTNPKNLSGQHKGRQLWNDLLLVLGQNEYPRKGLAILWNLIRLALYLIYKLIPGRNKLLGIYKNF